MKKTMLALMLLVTVLDGMAWAQESGGSQDLPRRGSGSAADARTRARLHTELASMYFQVGNIPTAIEELHAAVAADPRFPAIYSLAGLIHAFMQENDKAEEQFKKAMQLSPGDPDVSNNYGWFLCNSGRPRDSLNYFLDAVRNPLYKTPDLAYLNAGSCAMKIGDLEAANKYLIVALRLSRDGGNSVRIQMANLSYKQRKYDEARGLINSVITTMEEPPPEAFWLALRVERKRGDKVSEGSLAAQLRSRYPNSLEYQEFLKGNFE